MLQTALRNEYITVPSACPNKQSGFAYTQVWNVHTTFIVY